MAQGNRTVWLDSDEWYPVYSASEKEGYGYEAEVPAELVEHWRSVHEAFERVQREMGQWHEHARQKSLRQTEVQKAEKAVAEAQAKLAALKGDL